MNGPHLFFTELELAANNNLEYIPESDIFLEIENKKADLDFKDKNETPNN
jgi:hypothetical protein